MLHPPWAEIVSLCYTHHVLLVADRLAGWPNPPHIAIKTQTLHYSIQCTSFICPHLFFDKTRLIKWRQIRKALNKYNWDQDVFECVSNCKVEIDISIWSLWVISQLPLRWCEMNVENLDYSFPIIPPHFQNYMSPQDWVHLILQSKFHSKADIIMLKENRDRRIVHCVNC
jgi:hypothetical protein